MLDTAPGRSVQAAKGGLLARSAGRVSRRVHLSVGRGGGRLGGVAMAAATPFVLGLTGSIGMGKSAVSGMLRKHHVPVLDADQVVHDMYAPGGAAVEPVGALFPNAVVDGGISRPELGKYVLNQEENMKKLEAIVHPLVHAERQKFLSKTAEDGAPLVVLDIPLLYETGAEAGLDAVAVVSTGDAELQKQRVCARPGMTEEKFGSILARQVPDEEKRRRATHVVNTACSLEETEAQVLELIKSLPKPQAA